MNTFKKPALYVHHSKEYTFSLKFVPAQVRGNNYWSTSQVRLKIASYRTLEDVRGNSCSMCTSTVSGVDLEVLHVFGKAFFNTMDWWGICPTGPLPLPHHWRKNDLLPQSQGPMTCIESKLTLKRSLKNKICW